MPELIQNRNNSPARSRPLRVCLLVGDLQVHHCGVKDYAHQLASSLREIGVVVDLLSPGGSGLPALLGLRRELRSAGFDIHHVQYPSVGFRFSLLPFLVGLTLRSPRTVVTLHEYSRLPPLQRLATQLLRLSAHCIVFTTPEERNHFVRAAGADGLCSRIIPIGSNIPVAPSLAREPATVLYFGQIRPEKGLEAFLDLAEASRSAREPFRFHVVGACLPRHRDFLLQLEQKAPPNLSWHLGESPDQIARRLATALAAYLPFPDGASFRRGSLVAALANGVPVLSTITAVTPNALAAVVLASSSSAEALTHLRSLHHSPSRAAEIAHQGRLLVAPFSWARIAQDHLDAYDRVLRPIARWFPFRGGTRGSPSRPSPVRTSLNRQGGG